MPSASISIEALRKQFGSTLVVDDLSFAVRPGSVTGFLGPNGAGKTTTLRVLLGLVKPSAGRATIDGQAYRELAHPMRKVGAVLEGANFHPGRTAVNHLRVMAAAGRLDRARIDEMLSLVGLTEFGGKRVQGYSLGMKQRPGSQQRCWEIPRCSSSTSRPTGSIPRGSGGYEDSCARWRARAGPCWSRVTC